MIALPDRAWTAQGAQDRPWGAVRTDTSLEAAARWFEDHASAAVEAMAGREDRRAAHWGRGECGPARRADAGRQRARGRRLALARRPV